MSNDLIARLRDWSDGPDTDDLCREAAAEIEALKAAYSRVCDTGSRLEEECKRAYAEIEALRAAVLAEREACIERVKTCLYLDCEGGVLPMDANAEIHRCVAAIRSRKAVTP